jgi:hypothetical protein
MGRRLRWGGVVLACLLVPTGCGSGQDGAAASAAVDLASAVGDQRGADACRLLAPAARAELEDSSGKPCAEAVLEEDLGSATSPVDVQVFDTMARVRLADDTVFLSRFDGTWLVIAAACTPRGERPYDCGIQAS